MSPRQPAPSHPPQAAAGHAPPDNAAIDHALAELAALGSALGGMDFVQGPGGNVSVKTGNELWVKASGRRLADVAQPGGYSRVGMALARAALSGDATADRELFAKSPRPSLETYFHVLGARVVAHTHSIGSMWVGCSRSARVPTQVQGVPVHVVPYVPPGRDLALAIAQIVTDDREHLVLLRSHGLVAYAESAARAIELSRAFEEHVGWKALVRGSGLAAVLASYRAAPVEPTANGRVTRRLPAHRYPSAVLQGQVLFPDAAVYGSLQPVPPGPLASATTSIDSRRPLTLAAPDGERLLLARDPGALEFATELCATHDWLVDQLLSRNDAHFLSADDAAHIIGLPSEQYRMSLAVRPVAGA